MTTNRELALRAWREAIGDSAVVTEASQLDLHTQNTTGFRPRELVAILRPRATDQVVRIVRAAREFRIPLYPYSRGRNWGLGSKLPPIDGCALLDLAGLDRIRSVDVARHSAVIEAGVTQGQLSDYLQQQGLDLMLNVTGSSPQSSLVGNLLERGTGFTLHRTEELRGVEVVLGNGELIRTGYWADESPERPARHYKYGIGPHLDGLFCQSNYGVVTAVQLNLVPRPEAFKMFLFTFEHEAVGTIVDKVSSLYKQGALRWIVHMFNDKRMKTVNANRQDTPKWTGVTSVGGSEAYVRFVRNELEAQLGPACTGLHAIDATVASDAGADPVVRGLCQLHTGRPTTTFMSGLYHTLGTTMPLENLDDLDLSRYGMLTCLPMYPMSGDQVTEALDIVNVVCDRHGLVPAVTLNPVDADALESVTNLYFDRQDPAQAEAAQRCNEELHVALLKNGFRFYRIDIENMRHVVTETSTYWRTAAALKSALDPDNIIAPRRYNLV